MSGPQELLAGMAFWTSVLLVLVALSMAVLAIVLHVHGTYVDNRKQRRWLRWEPALLDALTGERSPATLHEELRGSAKLDYLELLVSFALRLDGDTRGVLKAAAAPLLDIGRKHLHYHRPDQRALGVHILGLLGSDSDLARLVDLLRDPSPGVAMASARALARSTREEFLPPVLRALDRFWNWDIASLASMLVLFGPHAGETLVAVLSDPTRSEATRAACAEATRRLSYAPAADAAADLLGNETDLPLEVATACLRLIRDAGSPAHATVVRELCDSDTEMIRMHAVSALATISLRPEDAARIEYALKDESSWVARRAARGLVESGRTSALVALAEGDDQSATLARQALSEAGIAR